MEKLQVTYLQFDIFWENKTKNISALSEMVSQVEDTQLIVLPEMFSTGFTMNTQLSEPENGETLQWMQKIAKTKNAAITGSLIIEEDKHFYNRLYFVFPDGNYKTYDKKHLFTLANEQNYYTAGDRKLIVDYLGWKICPLICYDLRFPVWARNTQDYDLLLYVANWPAKRTQAWDVLLQARAVENMCYTLGVNRVGKDGNDFDFVGHSAVYDYLGERINQNFRENEHTETVILSKEKMLEARKKLGFLNDRDSFTIN
ncbi:amidohydrolase [Mesonia sp. K7]|uniref:amidohydrolase n=1 Tax=Mesonia sp. K7 TaxID=2218606 RepID=UPI000DAAB7BA|nr:amidohydrolase [Mesonia sp. K7]PZD78995.1 amidohydrolase [Mesonia sp. K7]